MSDPTDQIWAYIHNELPPDEKIRVEQALENDPDLQRALDERKPTDALLKATLPSLDAEANDDALEAKLLAEWEAEHPEYAESTDVKPYRKIIKFAVPLAAAAAAMFLLLALPLQKGPIHWQPTAYGSTPQFRGDSNTKPNYSRKELKEAGHELQEAIEVSLAQINDTHEPWDLKLSLQELANGTLSTEISGYPRNVPESPQIWNNSFQSLEDFRSSIPRVGKQIAEDIAGRNDL